MAVDVGLLWPAVYAQGRESHEHRLGKIAREWTCAHQQETLDDSFTLFMGGLDFVLFAGFLWLVDALGWHRVVKPLVILGMSAIVVYLASELVDEGFTWVHWTGAGGKVVLRDWLYQHIFAGIASPTTPRCCTRSRMS